MHRESIVHSSHKQALLESLLESPLLIGDLDHSRCFDRKALVADLSQWESFELNFSQKLGHLYEDVLCYLLEQSQALELLDKSVQVFNEKRITLGELDYLLRSGEKLIHLELAVKFYLAYQPAGDEQVFYPGPDPRDNWENKLKRMESHQLSMAKSEHGRRLLLEKHGITEIEVEHLVYGKLFAHCSSIQSGDLPPLPRAVLDSTEFQPWIYFSEWDAYMECKSAHFIPKHLWPLATCQFSEGLVSTLERLSQSQFSEMIHDHGSCLMIWSTELAMPLFLVPDTWPEID